MVTIEDNNIEFKQTIEFLKKNSPVKAFDLFYKRSKNDKMRQYVFNDYFESIVEMVNKFKNEWVSLCADPSIKEHFYRLTEYCDNLREKPGTNQAFKEKLKVCANAYRLMDIDGINCGIVKFHEWDSIENPKNESNSYFCYKNKRLSKQCDYFDPKIRGFGELKWRIGDGVDEENDYGLGPRPEIDLDHDYDKMYRIYEITNHIIEAYKTICDPETQKYEMMGPGTFYKCSMLCNVDVDGIPDFITKKENKQFWETIEKIEALVTRYGSFFKDGFYPGI